MRFGILAIALLASCVAQRPMVGHAEVRDVVPLINSQSRTSTQMTFEKGRILVGGDGLLDVAVSEDGCVRGRYNVQDLVVCPGEQKKGEPLWYRSSGIDGTMYGIRMLEKGSLLEVQSGRYLFKLKLGKDAISEAVRDAPELIGAVFAYGMVPLAKDDLYELGPVQ